jgi:glycosyltransferase involved in cell wall biosynthesis
MRLLRLVRDTPHDVLYLNSFFDPDFSVLPAIASWLRMLRSKPLLISPRGEFSEGAYCIKHWRKRAYTVIARLAGVYRRVEWNATTTLEARDITRVLGVSESMIHTASDLVVLPAKNEDCEGMGAAANSLRVCFLSRISRIKNLDYALRILAKVRGEIHFSVYGPKEDQDYWAECELLADRLPPNVRMTYEGVVSADQVGAAFSKNDLLFLPTRGENFGYVFFESWAAGTPVLTSDQTPWRGLAGEGVGWDLGLDDERGFIAALEEASGWDVAKRVQVRQRSRSFAQRYALEDATVDDSRRMFFHMASSETRS